MAVVARAREAWSRKMKSRRRRVVAALRWCRLRRARGVAGVRDAVEGANRHAPPPLRGSLME
eukprot:6946959-Prymnesium_polylepis.1